MDKVEAAHCEDYENTSLYDNSQSRDGRHTDDRLRSKNSDPKIQE